MLIWSSFSSKVSYLGFSSSYRLPLNSDAKILVLPELICIEKLSFLRFYLKLSGMYRFFFFISILGIVIYPIWYLNLLFMLTSFCFDMCKSVFDLELWIGLSYMLLGETLCLLIITLLWDYGFSLLILSVGDLLIFITHFLLICFYGRIGIFSSGFCFFLTSF